MTIKIILILYFLGSAAILKAFMDKIAHSTSNHWSNKWKKTIDGRLILLNKAPKYYLGKYKPDYVEVFPYSSTILVCFTDAWHFYQFLMLRFIYMAICVPLELSLFYKVLFVFVIFPIFFSIIFEFTYSKLRKDG